MINVFRGWKRTLGCMTLMMAMLGLIEWLRSPRFADSAWLKITASKSVTVSSNQFGIVFEFTDFNPGPTSTLFIISSEDWSKGPLSSLSQVKWKFNWGGFKIGEITGPATTLLYIVPHWFAVIPLTFVAAWLLLSKSKKSSEKTVRAGA